VKSVSVAVFARASSGPSGGSATARNVSKRISRRASFVFSGESTAPTNSSPGSLGVYDDAYTESTSPLRSLTVWTSREVSPLPRMIERRSHAKTSGSDIEGPWKPISRYARRASFSFRTTRVFFCAGSTGVSAFGTRRAVSFPNVFSTSGRDAFGSTPPAITRTMFPGTYHLRK